MNLKEFTDYIKKETDIYEDSSMCFDNEIRFYI